MKALSDNALDPMVKYLPAAHNEIAVRQQASTKNVQVPLCLCTRTPLEVLDEPLSVFSPKILEVGRIDRIRKFRALKIHRQGSHYAAFP